MKKFVPVLLTGLLFCISASSQSMYRLAFKWPGTTDTTTYQGWLVLNQYEPGFMRLRFQNTSGNVLQQYRVEEELSAPAISTVLPDQVNYALSAPAILSGADTRSRPPMVLSFIRNKSTGNYEPAGVATSTAGSVQSFITSKFVDSTDMQQDIVLQFFQRDEPLVRNLFAIRPRNLTAAERNTRLFLIAVGNDVDSVIAESCRMDVNRMNSMFSRITNFLGIRYVPLVLTGAACSRANVQRQLNQLAPAANDIVIFYYSGHGFRKLKDNRPYPYIDLRTKPDNSYMTNSMNMEDIYQQIVRKNPRLALVLSDCCNTKVDATNAIAAPVPEKRVLESSWSQVNCRDLFLSPTKRSFLITAAEPDQKATSNNKFGGFFSFFFLTALESQFGVIKIGTSWEQVFQDTRRMTMHKASRTYCDKPFVPENICFQRPIWRQL